jgi:hypothetical protein
MNYSFSETTLNSFYQWLDNRLLTQGQAFYTNTSRYLYQPDSTLGTGYVAYAAPIKSFVWDSGVAGATVPTVISGSFGTLSRGQSGMMMDYVNGRVILPSSFGTAATISGSYSFKELNIYYANQSQERMVFTNKYYLNSRFNRTAATNTPPPYSMVTPCIFITNGTMENNPWAFGGTYETQFNITLNVMAENLSQLEGVLSILADSRLSYFPQLDPAAWPLNSFGDFKNGTGYSYSALVAQYGQPSNLYTIEEVKTSKVGDGVKINESIFVGICDLVISKPRSIH